MVKWLAPALVRNTVSADAKEILCVVQPLNFPHYPHMGHTTAVSCPVPSRISHLWGGKVQPEIDSGHQAALVNNWIRWAVLKLCIFSRKPHSLSQLHYGIGTYLSIHIKNTWVLSLNVSLNTSLKLKYHINELACYVQIFWAIKQSGMKGQCNSNHTSQKNCNSQETVKVGGILSYSQAWLNWHCKLFKVPEICLFCSPNRCIRWNFFWEKILQCNGEIKIRENRRRDKKPLELN